MNFIEKLKEEHEQIERELLELETIMEAEKLNHPNLIHTYKKLHDFWNEHELKEEKIFQILKHESIVVPVKMMLFEHEELRSHKKTLLEAINSGDEEKIKKVLEKQGSLIIRKIREHMNKEDEILYRITLENFTHEEIIETEKALNN